MEFPPSTIDELLSAMLDGALSEVEARELTRAMTADPTLQIRLDELSHSRTALLKGRSRGRLGSGFSSKVTELARSRAKEMGKDAPEWLRSKPNEPVRGSEFAPDVARPDVARPDMARPDMARPDMARPDVARKFVLRPWLYACTLVAVASFVFVFASIPKTEPVGPFAVNPNAKLRFPDSDKPDQDFIPKANFLDSTLLSDASDSDKSPSQRDAPKDTVTKDDSTTTAERLPTNPTSLVEQVRPDSLPATIPLNQNSGQLALSDIPKDFFLTMVLDITVDKLALENRALESIFEKYEIVYAEDLVIDADQLKALEDSRLVDSSVEDTSEKIGVMFLASTSEKISLAITDISDQYKDFPEFSMSMSFDKSASLLVKQLSGIKVDEEASGVVQRLLPPNAKGKATSFTTSLRKAGTKRLEKLPLQSNSSESQEKSYFLLLIRSAK